LVAFSGDAKKPWRIYGKSARGTLVSWQTTGRLRNNNLAKEGEGVMGYVRIKTEHAGAKHGRGFLTKNEVKLASKHKRRQESKRLAEGKS